MSELQNHNVRALARLLLEVTYQEDSSQSEPWEPPSPPELADFFPDFTIHNRIGQGAFAAVYLATQKCLNREVAIKLLRPNFGKDSDFEARFAREASALAKLDHPHIVHIHDHARTQAGHRYFVMEYLSGGTLDDLFASEDSINEETFFRLVRQLCDALQHAHNQGLVHRDIKPGNILMSRESDRLSAKIADFGIAKILAHQKSKFTDTEMHSNTHPHAAIGTPKFAAPEQINPLDQADPIDHRADIYSLGVVLRMLLQKVPGKPRKRIQRAISKATSYDRDDRHHSCTALHEEIKGKNHSGLLFSCLSVLIVLGALFGFTYNLPKLIPPEVNKKNTPIQTLFVPQQPGPIVNLRPGTLLLSTWPKESRINCGKGLSKWVDKDEAHHIWLHHRESHVPIFVEAASENAGRVSWVDNPGLHWFCQGRLRPEQIVKLNENREKEGQKLLIANQYYPNFRAPELYQCSKSCRSDEKEVHEEATLTGAGISTNTSFAFIGLLG